MALYWAYTAFVRLCQRFYKDSSRDLTRVSQRCRRTLYRVSAFGHYTDTLSGFRRAGGRSSRVVTGLLPFSKGSDK